MLTSCRYSIEYTKKKEKKDVVKFVKDETAKNDDNYKSHTVHVASGEPPNSVSNPVPKRKEGVVRPITQGKLLKAGGPSVRTCHAICANLSHPVSRSPLRRDLSPLASHFPVNLRRLLLSHHLLPLRHRPQPQALLVLLIACLHLHLELRLHHRHLLQNQKRSYTRQNSRSMARKARCR